MLAPRGTCACNDLRYQTSCPNRFVARRPWADQDLGLVLALAGVACAGGRCFVRRLAYSGYSTRLPVAMYSVLCGQRQRNFGDVAPVLAGLTARLFGEHSAARHGPTTANGSSLRLATRSVMPRA